MVVCAIAVLGVLAPGTAAAQDDTPVPSLPQSAELTVKIGEDGALHIAEAVSVPENTEMTRRIPLRRTAAHHRDRVYDVRDMVLEGSGDVTRTDDEVTVRLKQGTSVLRYTVDGAVAEHGGVLTAFWRLEGGWDTGLNLVRASVAAPSIASAVRCQLGPENGTYPPAECQAAQIDHTGLSRFSQQHLRPDHGMDITVELPPGLVPPNEDLEPSKTFAGAFVVTWPVGVAWVLFALLLLAGGGRVAVLRRRASSPIRPSPVEMLTEDGQFASPDGALPGHAGTVLANRMDPLDVAATVLDLAVRNYLWVSEVRAEDREIPDWLLVRRNDPDDQLTGYERAVFELVFGTEDAGPVPVSALAARGGDLGGVQDALYADVVRRRWFSRPPDRPSGRLAKAGPRIVGYGVFLTLLLACTAGYAQLGVILALAGGALAVAGRVLPARTARGHALARRLRGLADQVHGTRAKGVPKLERDVVFSRGLAYALALGEAPAWLAAFGQLKRAPAVYWYVAEKDAQALAGVEEFIGTLSGAFSVSAKLRRTRALGGVVAERVLVRRAGRTR
ncbi:DUF2207 domain-containing protein [Amycolatopsis minnesotensis]|uniref:DUF2207 domain-containing protein n=1 Tax=Amycolatopsis minnesotensis TaxID=337894 RepID=A0ABP5CXC9_9PSEU